MKNLLSHICLRPRASCICIQHVVDNIIHTLLIGFKDLHLFLHEACLLEKEWLRDGIAGWGCLKLSPHFIQESVHFLISHGLQLSLKMLYYLLWWCFESFISFDIAHLLYTSLINGSFIELRLEIQLFLRKLLFWNNARICHICTCIFKFELL